MSIDGRAPPFDNDGLLTSKARWIAAALVLLALARIASTYAVFNQTWDEGGHIACGLQWLDLGVYTYEHQHPPLARVAAALGPYLFGIHAFGDREPHQEGNEILYSGGHYWRTLTVARLGELPFFVLSCVVLWMWTRRIYGARAALAATFLYTMLPPVLAHAGLATTDMACSAFCFAALYAFTRWLEQPAWPEGLWLGAAIAGAALSKFSAFVFLPAAGAAILILYWSLERPPWPAWRGALPLRAASLAIALAALCLLIWAGYRFSVGRINPDARPYSQIDRYLPETALPAYELFDGIAEVQWHGLRGHQSWLLGQYSTDGWWYFFPVVLAVKTPLAFLALCAIGYWYLWWDRRFRLSKPKAASSGQTGETACPTKTKAWPQWAPAAAAPAVLAVCMPTSINLGVRHILLIYPLMAMLCGLALDRLLASWPQRKGPAVIGAVIAVWILVSSVAAHPDYLAYFNEVGAQKPEYFLAESDLDWGQDLQRLGDTLRARGIDDVMLAYFGTADPARHGIVHASPVPAYKRAKGWVAVSVHYLTIGAAALESRLGKSTSPLAWLEDEKPVARVGKSIYLYHVE